MARRWYRFGDLNPVTHPQTARTLDPSNSDGFVNIREAVDRVTTPDFLEHMPFPLKAVCLDAFSNVGDHPDGWHATVYESGEISLVKVIARVPELHSHLPEPVTYGKDTPKSMLAMYPVFTAAGKDLPEPKPGDIVYVDFGNRLRQEDPIYLGTVEAGIGAVDDEKGIPKKDTPGLAALGPVGDALASGADFDDLVESGQIPQPVPLPDEEQIFPTVSEDGREKAFRRGEEIGEVDILSWTNPDSTQESIVADMHDSLARMSIDMQDEIGYAIYINSGFRTNNEQQRLYRKFEQKGEPPTARPGYSNHQRGRAVDLAVWDVRKGKRFSLAHVPAALAWMHSNASKYNFNWSEGSRLKAPEPWHWNFVGNIEGLDNA